MREENAATSPAETPGSVHGGASAFLPACVVALGAVLLFTVEPLAGKALLPWFGGVPAVWMVCMLFFQGALLAGYAYAHVISSRLGRRWQTRLHLALLALSLLWLPPLLSPAWAPKDAAVPGLGILMRLAVMLGLPFVLLATSAPLAQLWHKTFRPDSSPYRLYALSNGAALLALAAYPFLIEPRLALREQAVLWSALYALYALCAGTAVWALRRSAPPAHEASAESGEAPRGARQLLWFFAPFLGSVLLLAVTAEITQDVAVVPFLWLLPLAVYLLSYILCFEGSGWYLRRYYLPLCVLCLALLTKTLWLRGEGGVVHDAAIWSVTLFVFCMVCHGELERAKPSHAFLTRYSLIIAAGGAAGGLFVGIAAPYIFSAYHELQWGLAAALALAAFPVVSQYRAARPLRAVAIVLWLAAAFSVGMTLERKLAWEQGVVARARNFYGTLRVVEELQGEQLFARRLEHGRIIHGLQYMQPKYRNMHVGYMGSRSGLALGLFYHGKMQQRRFGVIGLGTGTVASFAWQNDTLRFYEINPLVIDFAQRYFRYLKDTKADVSIVEGDGRLALAREEPQSFDFLVLDAFNGDAPPVHLLTREAFELYRRHLHPDGAIFAHISNRYVDFAPLLWKMADHLGMRGVLVESPAHLDWNVLPASWMIITHNENILNGSEIGQLAARREDVPGLRLWSDDYSSLSPLLATERILRVRE